MPGIAETAKKNQAAFYWHLGDLRAIYTFDEDIVHQPEHIAKPLTIADYETIAWPDFIDSQIAPFGTIPFFLGIGNHEIDSAAQDPRGFLAAICRLARYPGAARAASEGRSQRLTA